MTSRRKFLKRTWALGAGGLFVPTLLLRGQDFMANRRKAFQPAPAAGGYTAVATTFDGGTWAELDSTGGAADGKVGTVSLWWNPAGSNTDTMILLYTNGRFSVARAGGDYSIRLNLYDTSGNVVVDLRQNTSTVASLASTSGWCWIACSWNNDTAGACYLYIANAATSWVATDCSTRTDDTGGAETLDYTDYDWVVGSTLGGGAYLSGCLSEVYLDLSNYRDLSSSAVRDNFYNSTTHKPAGDLSAYGSPFIYLKNGGTNFITNSGSAGNLTKYGTAFTSCTAP